MRESISSNDRAAEVAELFRRPQWYLQGRNYHVRTRARIVSEILGESRFPRILDIGCGDGSISLPLLGQGTNLTLLDMSEEMLAIASSRVPERFKEQVKTLNGSFLQLELDPEGYDSILCLGVLAYIDSAKPLIEKLATLLRPGGRLLLECSDSGHFVSFLLRSLRPPRRASPATNHADGLALACRGPHGLPQCRLGARRDVPILLPSAYPAKNAQPGNPLPSDTGNLWKCSPQPCFMAGQ